MLQHGKKNKFSLLFQYGSPPWDVSLCTGLLQPFDYTI